MLRETRLSAKARDLGLFLAVSDSYKFGFMNPDDRAYFYPNTWAEEKTSGPDRLAIAPRASYIAALARLVESMPAPSWVLYVLVVPRGGCEAGRYQSAELHSTGDVQRFLGEFKDFLEQDGRHHLWIRSVSGAAMLVYDRHNLIYAYGLLAEFEAILSEIGLGKSKTLRIPDPHVHHYNEGFDAEERRVLEYWEWNRSPLLDADQN